MTKIHIVMNGVGEEFGARVSEWYPNGEIRGNGRSVVLIIDDSDLVNIKNLLGDHNEPKGLCEAIISPASVDSENEVYIGRELKSEIEKIEKSPSRHVKLSALPSELAKREENYKTETI